MKYLMIHHTASSQDTTAEQVNQWHKDKNWGTIENPIHVEVSSLGFYGQYHFFIEADGKTTQYRGLDEVGWHSGVWVMNHDSIAVCFAGNFNNDELTEAQKKSFKAVYQLIEGKTLKLLLHRDVKETSCPGKNITKKTITDLVSNDESHMKLVTTINTPNIFLIQGNKKIMLIDMPTRNSLSETPEVDNITYKELEAYEDGGTLVWINRIIN